MRRNEMFRGTKKSYLFPRKADLQYYLVLKYKYLPRQEIFAFCPYFSPRKRWLSYLPALTDIYIPAHHLEWNLAWKQLSRSVLYLPPEFPPAPWEPGQPTYCAPLLLVVTHRKPPPQLTLAPGPTQPQVTLEPGAWLLSPGKKGERNSTITLLSAF